MTPTAYTPPARREYGQLASTFSYLRGVLNPETRTRAASRMKPGKLQKGGGPAPKAMSTGGFRSRGAAVQRSARGPAERRDQPREGKPHGTSGDLRARWHKALNLPQPGKRTRTRDTQLKETQPVSSNGPGPELRRPHRSSASEAITWHDRSPGRHGRKGGRRREANPACRDTIEATDLNVVRGLPPGVAPPRVTHVEVRVPGRQRHAFDPRTVVIDQRTGRTVRSTQGTVSKMALPGMRSRRAGGRRPGGLRDQRVRALVEPGAHANRLGCYRESEWLKEPEVAPACTTDAARAAGNGGRLPRGTTTLLPAVGGRLASGSEPEQDRRSWSCRLHVRGPGELSRRC